MKDLVLGLDATRDQPSLALIQGTECLGEVDLPRRASHRLSSAALELLRAAVVEPASLARLAVCVGPGSFTGIRVGLAAALGLGRGWEKPVVGVDSFQAWADRSGGLGPWLVMIPLGRDGWTASVMKSGDRGFETVWGPANGAKEELIRTAPASKGLVGPAEEESSKVDGRGSLALSVARVSQGERALEARPWYGAQPLVLAGKNS